MAIDKSNAKAARGRARFEPEDDGKTLAVHLDRHGFRRLLATLERLAETGESQRFERSGRGRPPGDAATPGALVFHIEQGR